MHLNPVHLVAVFDDKLQELLKVDRVAPVRIDVADHGLNLIVAERLVAQSCRKEPG